MTIKEFAKICGCNAQTLRYYDSQGLLKPKKVDHYSGYRYYDKEQALEYVKIKNLQEAGFSLEEIKTLLKQDDNSIFEAFDKKIKEQEDKLERIKTIQKSYCSELQEMKKELKKSKHRLLMKWKIMIQLKNLVLVKTNTKTSLVEFVGSLTKSLIVVMNLV